MIEKKKEKKKVNYLNRQASSDLEEDLSNIAFILEYGHIDVIFDQAQPAQFFTVNRRRRGSRLWCRRHLFVRLFITLLFLQLLFLYYLQLITKNEFFYLGFFVYITTLISSIYNFCGDVNRGGRARRPVISNPRPATNTTRVHTVSKPVAFCNGRLQLQGKPSSKLDAAFIAAARHFAHFASCPQYEEKKNRRFIVTKKRATLPSFELSACVKSRV